MVSGRVPSSFGATGSWTTFATQTTPITATTGVHDVYLVAVGSGIGYGNFDYFTFT